MNKYDTIKKIYIIKSFSNNRKIKFMKIKWNNFLKEGYYYSITIILNHLNTKTVTITK